MKIQEMQTLEMYEPVKKEFAIRKTKEITLKRKRRFVIKKEKVFLPGEFVPALIDTGTEKIKISLKRIMIEKALDRDGFRSTIFSIGKYVCIPREIHMHPSLDRVMNVTFLHVPDEDKEIKVSIPLRIENKHLSPDIKKGSRLINVARYIKIKAKVKNIPASIAIDVSKHQKSKFTISDIEGIENLNVKFVHTSPNQTIAIIKKSRAAKTSSSNAS